MAQQRHRSGGGARSERAVPLETGAAHNPSCTARSPRQLLAAPGVPGPRARACDRACLMVPRRWCFWRQWASLAARGG